MAKPKFTTYHGIPGEGATVTEAKANAVRNLDALIDRISADPRYFLVHGVQTLVLPTIGGWNWLFLNNVNPTGSGRLHGGCCMSGTLEEAVFDAVRAAAQWAWTFSVSDDRKFATDAAKTAFMVLSPQQQERMVTDLLCHFGWQRDYKRLRDLGATDTEAHAHAGRDDGWLPVAA